MSLGWIVDSAPEDEPDVIHDLLAQLVAERPDDILWVAAAGNDAAGGEPWVLDRQTASHRALSRTVTACVLSFRCM